MRCAPKAIFLHHKSDETRLLFGQLLVAGQEFCRFANFANQSWFSQMVDCKNKVLTAFLLHFSEL